MEKWYTCCACGLSCQENEVEEVIDFQGKTDFMCHRCYHEYIGDDYEPDDDEGEDD